MFINATRVFKKVSYSLCVAHMFSILQTWEAVWGGLELTAVLGMGHTLDFCGHL